MNSLFPAVMCSLYSFKLAVRVCCFRSGNAGRTFMKLLVAADTDVVVGCHMVSVGGGLQNNASGARALCEVLDFRLAMHARAAF